MTETNERPALALARPPLRRGLTARDAALAYAVDVHSGWGSDLSGMIARHQPQHVILHTYHNFENADAARIFRRQVKSVQDNGRTVGYYVWAFQNYSPTQAVSESVALFRETAGHDVPVGWVDCETYNDGQFSDPGPTVEWLEEAGREFDRLGIRKGIYTSPDYANTRWGADANRLSGWLLWLASWDLVPELTSPHLPLFGWNSLAAKQWAVRLPNDQEIDRDIILPQFTVPDGASAPDPVDDVEALRQTVKGLRAALDIVVDDRLGTAIRSAEAAVDEAKQQLVQARAELAEARRIREQFLGA